ncbi:MAG: PCYCGC motif-containing (lipo)protein [Gemmatimonadota bacterium]
MFDRRAFLRIFPLGAVLFAAAPRNAWGAIDHPDPRPGIDGRDVLTAADLEGFPEETIALYERVREVAHIADGIGCSCGCSALPHYRSLLTCYHKGGMAMGCAICQGEARIVYRRVQEGQSLEQIRRAIDARYGSPTPLLSDGAGEDLGPSCH